MGENGKELIGDYELLSLIGDGAQGRVYRARCVADSLPHVKAGEEVALKVVRITGEDEKVRLKFQEQADILRRLSHTNIVSYRDCFAWHAGEWDEAQCLVMELLEGEPLSDRLKKASAGLPWPQVEEIFEQCLAGLIHARERGITHRDIKPSNIFITQSGQAKLIDFDIARRDDSGQMSTAGWKGTFDYMAPDFITIEGFRGDEVSDVFSLGVCFYQALTGSLPFEPLGETAHIGYLNRWRNNAAPTPSYRPGVFRVLSNAKNLVAKCLTARREQRYASFAAMLEDFRKIRYRRIRHKNKDEYELLAVLGRGGFGEVFKARRVSDGMLVAVKYLFSEKQSERFLKEAKILQQYPHPNLVKYVDFMVLDGTAGEKQYFLVMEFLEGMPGWTLRHRIKNEGRLEVTESVAVFCAYLSALQFLHGSARPIIHRDIKPGNLYAPMGQPEKSKIFDLGVARDVSGTVTVGGVPGTLDYMAPEFAEAGGDRGSPQSDLYALGLCLYEAIAGKPVFERLPTDLNSAWVAFQDRMRKPPPADFSGDAFVQYPRLRQVISKAISEKPELRYRGAAEMRVALEEALKPEGAAQEHDGFDAGEVTMATFTGGASASAEPVTLGTRPLEAVGGGTLSGAVDLVAAGRQEAARRKKKRTLALVGGLAAALAVFGLAGVWLGQKFSGGGRPAEPPAAEPARPQPPAAEPARPEPAEATRTEPAKPQPPPTEPAKPEPAEPAKPAPVPPERDPVFLSLTSELPAAFARPADWTVGEAAAAKLAAQERQPWPGLDEAEKARRLGVLRDLLKTRAAAYVTQARDAALAAYAADADGAADRERLAALTAERYPLLAALVADELAEALRRVDVARAGFAVVQTLAALPGRVAEAADPAAAQTLADAFVKLEGTPGVTLRPEQVRAAEQALAARFQSFAEGFAQAARAHYEAGRLDEGAASQRPLTELAAAVAPRFGKEAVARLEGETEAARQAAAARVAQAADARAAQLANAGRLLDDLDARVRKGDLAGCPDGVAILGGVTPELLADAGLKARWDASRAAYLKLVETALLQRDPLDARAERLAAADAALGHAAAPAVFAAERAALRKSLDQQKAVSILRLVNQGANPVTVSAKELRDKATLAGGEVKEWAVPVAAEQQTVSVQVDGGNRFRSRIETVRLPRAGGLERALGALDAEAAKPAEPVVAVTPPAAPPVTPPVTAPPATPPAATAEPVAPSVTATGAAALEIIVSPKSATVLVDDKPVEAGRVTVTPNENHKVAVTCDGYKPVQQYYRVQPGQTRRIDILLEKEPKKSLFGF